MIEVEKLSRQQIVFVLNRPTCTMAVYTEMQQSAENLTRSPGKQRPNKSFSCEHGCCESHDAAGDREYEDRRAMSNVMAPLPVPAK